MKKYYRLLKDCFEDKDSVLTELINLEAIQHLPKGTEFFVSDLHGEYGAFDYLLRNGSGIVRKKIEECFEETRHGAGSGSTGSVYWKQVYLF